MNDDKMEKAKSVQHTFPKICPMMKRRASGREYTECIEGKCSWWITLEETVTERGTGISSCISSMSGCAIAMIPVQMHHKLR